MFHTALNIMLLLLSNLQGAKILICDSASCMKAPTLQVASNKQLKGRPFTIRKLMLGQPLWSSTRATSEKQTLELAVFTLEKRRPPAVAVSRIAIQNSSATKPLVKAVCGTIDPKPIVDMLWTERFKPSENVHGSSFNKQFIPSFSMQKRTAKKMISTKYLADQQKGGSP